MAKQSQAWKNAERSVAKLLRGKRVLRGADFSVEDVDVIVPDFPELRIDSKYRQRHAHHTFVDEIVRKYCSKAGDEPVLVTKHARQKSAYVTVRLELFATLLDRIRAINNNSQPRNTNESQHPVVRSGRRTRSRRWRRELLKVLRRKRQ